MADMDLLLLTSRAEGLPNVLVEAQAVGTPVVTPPVGGAPETVRHGLTGWILTAGRPRPYRPNDCRAFARPRVAEKSWRGRARIRSELV